MAELEEYPLQEVLGIKHKRVDEAERVVAKRKEELEKEQAILKEKEEERDQVKLHETNKMNQLREAMDKGGINTDELQQMRVYIQVVQERVAEKQKLVDAQMEKVTAAEKNLEAAQEELRQRRKEVEKIETHRTAWMKEARREFELKEAVEADEIGSIMYLNNQRKKEQ